MVRKLKSKCEGACQTHTGRPILVLVSDKKNNIKWGVFTYCENAIKLDKKNGLTVEKTR